MAFGTTPIIDSFNRANGALASSTCSNGVNNWAATGTDSGAVGFTITSNQVSAAAAGNAYIAQTFGPDCEVYCTIVDPPNAGGYVLLQARVGNIGATWKAYMLIWTTGALGWEIRRVDAGLQTNIASSATALVAGDKMGFELIGARLTGYRFTGGAWTQVLTVVDANYGDSGFIAMALDVTGGANIVDDFGGGNIVSPVIGTDHANLGWTTA